MGLPQQVGVDQVRSDVLSWGFSSTISIIASWLLQHTIIAIWQFNINLTIGVKILRLQATQMYPL
jgi:hypothetical protein